MTGLLLALLFTIVMGIICSLLIYFTNKFTRQAITRFEVRFKDADQIINQNQVPEDWIGGYRRKIDQFQTSGESSEKIDRIGKGAKRSVLNKIDSLYKLMEIGKFYDSTETKLMVLNTLEQRKMDWQERNWQDLFVAFPGDNVNLYAQETDSKID